jgi:hypothetical protein
LLLTHAAFGQASQVRGGLTIIVTDPDGKAVAGAIVTVTDRATSTPTPLKTASDGRVSLGNLDPGKYDITVTAPNFKTAKYEDVEVVIARVYDLTVKLEIGAVTMETTVQAGGQEVLETINSSIQTTISGRSITQLPLTSHQGTLLGVLDPGAQTQGGARNTVFEGLPRVGVNITFDGINVMDNQLKSSCGFFAMLDARIDDVEQFGIQTAANSPDKNAEGAVQIAYVSKRGQNPWHGGVWEYNRNTIYNANYFMNNLFSSPRTGIDLNEWGGKAGGHILKDKLFIFADVDDFTLPVSGFTTSATILNPGAGATAANGFYTYLPTTTPTSLAPNAWTTCTGLTATSTCTVNLMSGVNSLAANNGQPTTMDAFISHELGILNTAPTGNNIIGITASGLNQESVSFGVPAAAHSVVPDIRVDYQANKNNEFELDYHYLFNDRVPDFLNGFLPLYPVAPYSANSGSTIQNRNLFVAAWTWNLASNKSNQLRIGVQSAPTTFGPNIQFTPALGYPTVQTQFPGLERSVVGINGYSSPTLGFGDNQGRNVALGQLHEVFTWSRGAHSLSFGYDQTDVHGQSWSQNGASISTGLASQDPIILGPMFTEGAAFSGNLPGMGATDLGTIEGIYGTFIGHVTAFSDSSAAAFRPNAAINGGNPGFVNGASTITRINQNELGFWGADSWRVRNGLTFNFGLRWEYQGVPNDPWGEYFANQGGFADIWGMSGVGNLFDPGADAGKPFSIAGLGTTASPYVYNSGEFLTNDTNYKWYHKYYRGLAPSVGFAYTPRFDGKIAKAIFGGQGKSVIRAGYAISYGREGASPLEVITGFNLGNTAAQTTTAGTTNNTNNGSFVAGSVTVNQLVTGTVMPGVLENPTQFVTQEPLNTANANFGGAQFAPNLHPPMVMSYSLGWQRELSPNMVLEIRYAGNHGEGLWREVSIEETNIFENGFLTEFNNAVSNMNLCSNNAATCVAAEKDTGILTQGSTATTPSADFANLFSAATAACVANPAMASCATSLTPIAGEVNLPILTAALGTNTTVANGSEVVLPANLFTAETTGVGTGGAAGFQSSANFRNATFITDLKDGLAGSMASSLAGSTTFFPSLVVAGFPGNFWRVDPNSEFGGSIVECNCSQSTYNGGTVDFRRRPSHGLQFDISYTYSKSLTNYYSNSSQTNTQSWTTLRNTGYDKGPAPYNLENAVKSQLIWDLPFGAGRKWSSSSNVVNRIIGGWSFNAITRWQTGPPVQIESGLGGTFNASDPGVNLLGITTGQLQSQLGINETEGGTGNAASKWVYYVPASLLDANLQKANTSIIQPCNVAGTLCSRLYMYGPQFLRADWSIVKTTKITERVNVEIRMEALDAFNNADFGWCAFSQSTAGGCSVTTQNTSFGRTGLGTRNGAAYYDFNTTWDPGGRNLQLVGRVNF